jgi:hypothetical protein
MVAYTTTLHDVTNDHFPVKTKFKVEILNSERAVTQEEDKVQNDPRIKKFKILQKFITDEVNRTSRSMKQGDGGGISNRFL